jgi:hypothetical protein
MSNVYTYEWAHEVMRQIGKQNIDKDDKKIEINIFTHIVQYLLFKIYSEEDVIEKSYSPLIVRELIYISFKNPKDVLQETMRESIPEQVESVWKLMLNVTSDGMYHNSYDNRLSELKDLTEDIPFYRNHMTAIAAYLREIGK